MIAHLIVLLWAIVYHIGTHLWNTGYSYIFCFENIVLFTFDPDAELFLGCYGFLTLWNTFEISTILFDVTTKIRDCQ